MDIARFKDSDGDKENYKIVKAINISPMENERVYKGHLFCQYTNCNAQLVYNERHKGGFTRYFSTLKGSEHEIGCPNRILHELKGISMIKNVETTSTAKRKVSANHNEYKENEYREAVYEINGTVKGIRRDKNEIFIDVVSDNGRRLSAYIGQVFRSQSEEAFELFDYIDNYIKEKTLQHMNVSWTSTGKIAEVDNKKVIEISDYSSIFIDRFSFFEIVHKMNKLI